MLIRIDARRLTGPAGLHAALDEALGFGPAYGKNLDALTDCLTHLDNPAAAMSRVQAFPGQVVLLVIEHTEGAGKAAAAQIKALADVAAFVNWRRLEKKQPPVVAVAYEPP
jgi:RNAse (barnase) inhibitor barstar